MVKRMLWKDIRQTLSKSKGRVVSIVCLMALGSFALVGLKVTGPDMQATAADFYGRNNLADITVVSNYGISKDDERIIGKADGIKEVEYGYFKDVVISMAMGDVTTDAFSIVNGKVHLGPIYLEKEGTRSKFL